MMSERVYCRECGGQTYPSPRGWCCVPCLVTALDKDQARTYDPRTHRAISVEALGVLASSTENFRFMLEDMGPGTVDAHDLSEVLATSGAALADARSLLEEQDDE